jgi:hypothetical protein
MFRLNDFGWDGNHYVCVCGPSKKKNTHVARFSATARGGSRRLAVGGAAASDKDGAVWRTLATGDIGMIWCFGRPD